MKTRKITVFAIASILGAIALTGCGRAVETSMNAGQIQTATNAVQTTMATTSAVTQPTIEQSATATVSSTESVPVAQNVSYDANTNTVSYTQQPAAQAPVQQSAPAYQAATSAEQAAANNALAYAGGNGKIVSSEAIQTSDGSTAYRFGIGTIKSYAYKPGPHVEPLILFYGLVWRYPLCHIGGGDHGFREPFICVGIRQTCDCNPIVVNAQALWRICLNPRKHLICCKVFILQHGHQLV